jgi:hypothetical protein
MTKKTIDKEQITLFWKIVNHSNKNHKFQVFKKDNTVTKFIDVDTVEKLIELCEKYNLEGISCLSVNPTDKKKTKTDSITEINNILIDIDVKKQRKKEGVSTAEDKAEAKKTAEAIIKKLEETTNLRVSLFVDSGNGFHVYIPVQINLDGFFTGKNEDENKELWDNSDIKGRLVYLEQQLQEYNNDIVEIDCISKDIARRVKITGTWNVKEGIAEENYRLSKIIEAHEDVLEKLYIESNTTVFNAFKPVKDVLENQTELEELPVDENIDLAEILKTDLKAQQLFNGEWKKHNYKSRSEAEIGLAVILLSKGLPEKRVRLALQRSAIGKWKKSPKQYQNVTIKKAKQFIRTRPKKKKHSEEVITTINKGNLIVELLDPDSAWSEIKCYEITEEFVLQPIYHPVRGKREVTDKSGNIETKTFETMSILLLCCDKNEKREVIYPYTGRFSDSTVYINDSKYKIPSEPFYLKTLPSTKLLTRFLKGESVDGKEVWKQFKQYRESYLDVGEDKRKYIIQTAWDLGTHFHNVFNAYPYQDFFGFRGSGKNRAHEISNELCFHAQMIATPRGISSIFRSIDAMGSTWLKNEAETLIGKNRDNDLYELCLEGYKKGSNISLTGDKGKNKSRPPIFFDVYSPKSFASDKNIYGAFGTRMIKYLQQKTSGKQGNVELDKEIAREIRDNAYLLRLQDGCKIAEKSKTTIEELLKGYELKLVSRDREIFTPILLITKEYASEQEYEDLIAFITDYLEAQKQESIDQPIAIVLRALYQICIEEQSLQQNQDEFWIGLQDVRTNIIFDDPEAWRITNKSGYEDKEIIKTSETAKYYTERKIGAILTALGFEQKRREKGKYQRKVSIKKIESKANTLNIAIKDLKEEKPKPETKQEVFLSD